MNVRWSRLRTVVVGLALVMGLASCQGADGSDAAAGVARMAITNVPADVACIRVTAAGARTVSHDFDVTAGQPATFLIHGLPVGEVTFSALGLPSACSSSSSAEEATWTSDSVAAPRRAS